MKLPEYIHLLKALPSGKLTKQDLLVEPFCLHKEGNLEIYYAPFEYLNTDAKVVFVGITPGFTQMEIAYRVARDGLLQGDWPGDIVKRVKQEASLAGAMRKNVYEMLDGIGLATALSIPSTATLYAADRKLLHSTSVIHFPVFIGGKNYTGHNPPLLRTPVFHEYIQGYFHNEVMTLTTALFVPMGKAVSDVLQGFIEEGLLAEQQCLLGFPHPSGANGHRKRQYSELRDGFSRKVRDWFPR